MRREVEISLILLLLGMAVAAGAVGASPHQAADDGASRAEECYEVVSDSHESLSSDEDVKPADLREAMESWVEPCEPFMSESSNQGPFDNVEMGPVQNATEGLGCSVSGPGIAEFELAITDRQPVRVLDAGWAIARSSKAVYTGAMGSVDVTESGGPHGNGWATIRYGPVLAWGAGNSAPDCQEVTGDGIITASGDTIYIPPPVGVGVGLDAKVIIPIGVAGGP